MNLFQYNDINNCCFSLVLIQNITTLYILFLFTSIYFSVISRCTDEFLLALHDGFAGVIAYI